MQRSELRFSLPEELIAKTPPTERGQSRLLSAQANVIEDRLFADVERLLDPSWLVVMNRSRVIPARLLGHKRDTGGKVELLLVSRLPDAEGATEGGEERWIALTKSSKGFSPGATLEFDEGLRAEWVRRVGARGEAEVRLVPPVGASVEQMLERVGKVPLPPYLGRAATDADRDRYQTVYADRRGSIAAPTAGLHFSERLMTRLRERGQPMAMVTLHVGLGTFQPVEVDELDHHPMHEEWFEVDAACEQAVAEARARGAKVLAVGTTSLRALESAAAPARPGLVRAQQNRTRLLVQPGYRFQVVDSLITNFHLPESTLLALVMAFSGVDWIRTVYEHAVAHRYQFFSYGDAMWLSRADL